MAEGEVQKERKFLHEISNQLVVSHGMGHFVLDYVKEQEGFDEKMLDRLEKALGSVDKIVQLVRDDELRTYNQLGFHLSWSHTTLPNVFVRLEPHCVEMEYKESRA